MSRPQLTAVNHYDVFPFNHGGSLGIRGLYKALSEWFDINIITFVNWDIYPNEVSISNHIKVIPIVKPRGFIELEEEMHKAYNMHSGTLIDVSPSVGRYCHTFPEIISKVREIAGRSIIVIAEHAYTFRIISSACPDKHLWYRANNVEYDYKLVGWRKIGCPQDLLQEVFNLEKECCEVCEKILTVSEIEADRFAKIYGIDKEKFLNISSGFDTDNLNPILPEKRVKYSREYPNTGLFIASNTPVTVAAAQDILLEARKLPEVSFIIAGNVSKGLRDIEIPDNVTVAGIVSDEIKFSYLKSCDFALNFIEGGAGINVKMFEYFAYGLPVITTKYGARGIALTDRKNCFITSKSNYTADITAFCRLSMLERNEIAINALDMLKNKYSWRIIGQKIADMIQQMYSYPVEASQIKDLADIALYSVKSQDSYIPSKPVYIRGAGEWGQKCLEFLLGNGISPLGFVDKDSDKYGKKIGKVEIISLEEFSRLYNDCEIVVALPTFVPVAAQLLHMGIAIDSISIAIHGERILSLAELNGNCPYYHIGTKIKNAVIKEAKRLGGEIC